MIIIGENIHIIAKAVNQAITNRDSKFIWDLTRAQSEAGADYLDLNLGPLSKNPSETIQWVVSTVQEIIGLALSIDTLNPEAMEAGLVLCKKRPLINSASGKREHKEKILPLARKYNCDVVISVMNDRGMPPDVDLKVESIMDSVAYANELGLANEDIWVDPIVLPVSTAGEGQRLAQVVLDFIRIIGDVLPGIKSTVGLSNISNGVPKELRSILNRTFLVMLARYGLYSAIANPLDTELMRLARGEESGIVNLIHRTMEGEDIDPTMLSQREINYVKTVKVLTGEVLFSDAWLE
jgi:cobalamin-dependent methionine synthase I